MAIRRRLWWFALALGFLGACSDKDSDTRIMVAVWTNLSVPEEIDSIRIVAKGSTTSPSRNFPLITGSAMEVIKFPVVWELVSPDNRNTAFEITASGYLGTTVVVAQSARLSFDPGHSRVLTLFLDRACMHAISGPCTQPIPIDVTSLPKYDPKTPFLAPDASAGNPDAAGGEHAEAGEVAISVDADVKADAPQIGDTTAVDTKPDAGPATPADAPADQPFTDDLGKDQAGPDGRCVLGCIPQGDASADLQALDAAREVSAEAADAVPDGAIDRAPDTHVFRDSAPDLAPNLAPDLAPDLRADLAPDLAPDLSPDLSPDLAPDLSRDLTPPDDTAACVLPMTTCTGACIHPQTNASHCGGCGQACGTQNGTPSCTAAVCSMASCSPGFLDCSTDENTSRNGCETNGNTDRANCGHCGNVCSSRVCQNQVCLATARYGNTGPGTTDSSFSTNFLAGIQVYIPNDCVVTGFGAVLYSGATSANMYLGLYKDVAGNPGARVATVSSPALVSSGGKEMEVEPPMPVTAGTYWILGVWDDLASFASNSATKVTWRYISYPYGALPATAPTSMVAVDLAPPNLFVIVAQ